MKVLSLKLPDDLDARIRSLAMQRRSNKSEVVRIALEAYLAQEAPTQPGSALDLAGELVGAVEGPEDLSHQLAHLRGYGE
jgi:predicted transcriptional regulator